MANRTITVVGGVGSSAGYTGGAGISITGSTINIAAAGVVSTMLANDAVTNAAIALNAVAGNNLNSAGIAQTFTGNVVFLSGASIIFGGTTTSEPLVVINNTSLSLFSANNGASTPSGLTSNPYVQIESVGILVASGGTGPSTVVGTFTPPGGSPTNGVVFWASNGVGTSPYTAIDSSGITISFGSSSGIQALISSPGIELDNNGYSAVFSSTQLVLNGGASGTQLIMTSSSIQMVNGNYDLTMSSGQIEMSTGGSTGNQHLIVTATEVQIAEVSGTYGAVTIACSSSQSGATLSAGSGGGVAFIGGNPASGGSSPAGYAVLTLGNTTTPGFVQILAGPPAFQFVVNSQQILSTRKTGPGAPSGFADSTAQTWCTNLYNALASASGHGLIN